MTQNEAIQKVCHLTMANATRTLCITDRCMAWRANDCALIPKPMSRASGYADGREPIPVKLSADDLYSLTHR